MSSPKRDEVIESEEVTEDESEEDLGDGVLEVEVISVSAWMRGKKEKKAAMKKVRERFLAFSKVFSGR
jgi:hypothetical protein